MPAPAARRTAKPEVSPAPKEGAAGTQIQVAEGARHAAPSPARALQVRLERDLRADAPGQAEQTRWPLYAALTFWGGVSSLMWAAIIGCVWLLVRHI